MHEIYLDNSATTRTDPDVAQAALDMMLENYGNPSSLHKKGLDAQLKLEDARRQVASVIGASPNEIIFTSGGTESNNLALFGAAQATRRRGKTIVATAVEHASILAPLKELEKMGYTIKLVAPLPDGTVDSAAVAALVDENTALVSCMLVNSEVGSILEVEQITRAVRQKKPDVLIHSDGVQAFGKLPISIKRLGVDLFTASSHKIHGPKGCGALYIRKGTRIIPQLYGGSQERALRAGTENTSLACAFGFAAQKAQALQRDSLRHVANIYEYFVNIGKQIPGICINSPQNGTPYIYNLSVIGYRSEILLHFLEGNGIYVSSGSACSKGARSHVLSAMGLPQKRIDSALRISFSRYSTKDEVDVFWQVLQEGMRTLIKS